MIRGFLDALASAGLDLSAEEAADVLWLALHLEKPEPAEERTEEKPDEETEPGQPERHEPAPPSSVQAPSPRPDAPEPLRVHTPSSQGAATDRPTRRGRNVESPGVTALPGALAIARAFRPFKRRVPSRTRFVLDEEATVSRIAEGGPKVPVLKPAPERWLELALVVDASPTLVLWRETIAELRLLLERHGAFRNVRTWTLLEADGAIRLRTGWGSAHPAQATRSPRELVDPDGRRLILVVSDCVSETWHSGQMMKEALAVWGDKGPLALIQLLPAHLWERTGLGFGEDARLSTPLPGVANRHLQVLGRWNRWRPLNAKELALPTFTLEPGPVAAWSRLVAGTSGTGLPGKLFDAEPVEASEETVADDAVAAMPTAAERVTDFRAGASPLARRLAGYLATTSLSLPVMRLVQAVMLPESRQVHLAEVFLGGILKQVTPEGTVRPEEVQYDFEDGVRELLLNDVRAHEAVRVVEEISAWLERQTGVKYGFTAVIEDSEAAEGVILDDRSRPFAEVTAGVLRRMGGEQFGRAAAQLEEKLAEGGSGIATTERPEGIALRVLAVTSDSAEHSHPLVEREVEVLRSIQGIKVDRLDEPTPTELRVRLLQEDFDVVHYRGYGLYDPERRERSMLLWDDQRQPFPISARVLGDIFRGSPSLRLVLIHIIMPGRSERDSTEEMAAALVAAGTPAVIAIQEQVSDFAAVGFSRTLYESLAAGERIDNAFAIAQAMMGLHGGHFMEGASPVLLMLRSKGGQDSPPTLAQEKSQISRRFALLVGIDQYSDPRIPFLRRSVNDVLALRQTLVPLGYQVLLLSDHKATRSQVQRSLDGLCSNAGPDDLVLVHFSGHTFTYSTEKGVSESFLVTFDTRADAGITTELSLWEVVRRLRDSPARGKVLLIDSDLRHGLTDPGLAFFAGTGSESSSRTHGLLTQLVLEALQEDSLTIQNLGDRILQAYEKDSRPERIPPIVQIESFGNLLLAEPDARIYFSQPAPSTLFTLEALQAKHGDALLLHFGSTDDPRLILIDGGPAGTYRDVLRPHLERLRQQRNPDEPLPIDLVIVSHMDDPQLRGVIDLLKHLVECQETSQPPPFKVLDLWCNSVQVESSPDDEKSSGRGKHHLLEYAERLGLSINRPFSGEWVVATATNQPVIDLDGGLRLRVLGPRFEHMLALQEGHGRSPSNVPALGSPASGAPPEKYRDRSVANLASIVVLAEFLDKRVLLTGDSRGDLILASLDEAGLLDSEGRFHVDVLKLPHQGSGQNASVDFFRRVTAAHYLISGYGPNARPPGALDMLLEARPDEPFTLHFTYPMDSLLSRSHREQAAKGRFKVQIPASGEGVVRIELV